MQNRKKITSVLVVAIFTWILLSEAVVAISLTSFEDCEGARVSAEEFFITDERTLNKDFSEFALILDSKVVNDFNSLLYSSDAIVESYEDRTGYFPSYKNDRETRKALRALLKVQEANILLLDQYEHLQTRTNEWLVEAEEQGLRGIDLADARAILLKAKEQREAIDELERCVLDEDNTSFKNPVLIEEAKARGDILTVQKDWRKSVMSAASILSGLLESQDDAWKTSKESFDGDLIVIKQGLSQVESMVSSLEEGPQRSAFESSFSELLKELEEIESRGVDGHFIEAAQKQKGLESSLASLKADVSKEIKAEADRKQAQIEKAEEIKKKEEDMRRKRNGMLIVFFSAIACLMPAAGKAVEWKRVDDDLRRTVGREFLKAVLAGAAVLVVLMFLTSLYSGFPLSFFLAIPRNPSAKSSKLYSKLLVSPSFLLVKNIRACTSAYQGVKGSIFNGHVVPDDMLQPRPTPAPLPNPQPSPEPDILPLLPPDADTIVPQFETNITPEALDSMAVHAISCLKPKVRECYGTIYANSNGTIVRYHAIDSEEFTLRTRSAVNFTPQFYEHVRTLADIYKNINLHLAGDNHSHPNGYPAQSSNDIAFNSSFWKTARNTCFITGTDKGRGKDFWTLHDNGFEARRKVGNYLIRIRAYAGSGDEQKKIIIRTPER